MQASVPSAPEGEKEGTLRSLYAKLATHRLPFLNRARACAALTIPTLILPEGHTATSPLPTPYQSLGARGVNNLAAKLTLTQFPPNQPCFKNSMSERTREELAADVGEVEKALSKSERIVTRDIETSIFRPAVYLAMKHLIVAGNVLVYDDPKTRSLRVFPLTQYVCQRDAAGTALMIIVKESVSPETLPEDLEEMAREHVRKANNGSKTVDVYTGIKLEDDRYEVWQELCDTEVPGSEGTFPKDSCPWVCARLFITENEDYGRGYVEEYHGDLMTLEVLSKSITLHSVAAAKLVFMVNPNGATDEEDFVNAESGDVISGSAEDITVPNIDKRMDIAAVQNRINVLREELSYVFLLNSAIQRKGERVTAEEIRYMANELDAGLGGIYSGLSQEFQLPIIRARIAHLSRKGELPPMPRKIVEPMITTGVDAIGRGNDFQKLREFASFMLETFGPEVVKERLNPTEMSRRGAAALGIEDDGLVLTEDQVAAQQQQAQMAQMAQAAVAPTITQAGQMAQAQTPAQ